ncbi:Hsp70 family protein [Glycomyces sp. NPDC048151]|uniref:Hsp70 family protein n=1 Tax=Glycomyces sp. NPDC048151 TaxID=3364002 RepID=UPI00371E3470
MTPHHLLGVDFGTSHVVAALRTPDGRTRPLLFDGSPLLPSAVFLDVAEEVHIGRDALRLAVGSPDRFEPNPKRHVGESSILLGDSEIEMSTVLAAVFAKVQRACAEETPVPPPVVLTHPSTWGDRKIGLLRDAAAAAGFPSVETVSEPVAAVSYYERELGQRIEPGEALAVVDLGGGTVDIAVLARQGDGPPAVVVEGGLSGFGGIDIDMAVVEHLRTTAPEDEADFWAGVAQPETDRQRRERNQVWTEAREAKEMLSRATTAPVALPGRDTTAHLTRTELEAIAEPLLAPVTAELDRVRERAESGGHVLAAIFLVGGAARMPLAASVIHRSTGIAPVLIERPELVVADGAARFADADATAERSAAAATTAPLAPAEGAPTAPNATAPTDTNAAATLVDGTPGPLTPPNVNLTPPSAPVGAQPILPAHPRRPRRRLAIAGAVVAALAMLAAGIYLPNSRFWPGAEQGPVSGSIGTTAGTVCDEAVPAFPEGATGFLRGPHFELRPSCAGTLTPTEAEALDWLIEDLPELNPDQRLAVVHFDAAAQLLDLPADSVYEVATEVVIGDRTWKLTGLPVEDTLYYGVIPDGDPAEVKVTDADRSQSLDFGTGAVKDPVSALYHGQLGDRVMQVEWEVKRASRDEEWTNESFMDDPFAISRQVFDEATGWLCEPDSALVTAEFFYITDTVAHDLRTEFDPATQFWVNTEAGPIYASSVVADPYFHENDNPDGEGEALAITMQFAVPADMTVIEFAFQVTHEQHYYREDVWLYIVEGDPLNYYKVDYSA